MGTAELEPRCWVASMHLRLKNYGLAVAHGRELEKAASKVSMWC
jgi:hypothetical protein